MAHAVAIAFINTEMAANEFVKSIFSLFTIRFALVKNVTGDACLFVIEITSIFLLFAKSAASIVSLSKAEMKIQSVNLLDLEKVYVH